MVAGHLQEKNGTYYIVLTYIDDMGKRKQPWFPTGLPIKGNRRRAEAALMEKRRTFIIPKITRCGDLSDDMLFADYMETWLNIIKGSIATTTYSSYSMMVKKKIAPYFRNLGVSLGGLEARHIQAYYLHELQSLSANSVIHEHANIHKALKYAVQLDLIASNPADKVERPRKQRYIGDYYTASELETLFEVTKDHRYSLIIQMAAFYGLRRSELLGLKWSAFDFENNTVTVKHIVTEAMIDGKKVLIQADRAKTKSSLRSLPLIEMFRDRLLALKEQHKYNRTVCGNSYNNEFAGYVFVDELGNIVKPHNLSHEFSRILERNNLRHIRFHDLRHSCASLLLANGVPMKQIQEWLGHSDIATTANIYAHLDVTSKVVSASAIEQALSVPDTPSEIKHW